jgi:hypothetical protein
MPATDYQRQVVTRLTEIIGRKPDYREFTQKPYLRVKWYTGYDLLTSVAKAVANYLLTNPNIIACNGVGLQFKIPPTRDYKKPATRKRSKYQSQMHAAMRGFWVRSEAEALRENLIKTEHDQQKEKSYTGELLRPPYIHFEQGDIEDLSLKVEFGGYQEKDRQTHIGLGVFLDWCDEHDIPYKWGSYELVVSIPKM